MKAANRKKMIKCGLLWQHRSLALFSHNVGVSIFSADGDYNRWFFRYRKNAQQSDNWRKCLWNHFWGSSRDDFGHNIALDWVNLQWEAGKATDVFHLVWPLDRKVYGAHWYSAKKLVVRFDRKAMKASSERRSILCEVMVYTSGLPVISCWFQEQL